MTKKKKKKKNHKKKNPTSKGIYFGGWEDLLRFPAGIAQAQVGLLGAVLGKRKKASLTSLFWC